MGEQPRHAIADSRVSARVQSFPESVIREMTRLCLHHGGVNLAQGFPDFPAPLELKQAAKAAIDADLNQYAITWGAPRLREAIAVAVKRTYGLEVDPGRDVTVTCGSTEAMMAAMLALIDPGDEAVILEPFYENYGPDAIVSGASPRFVPLRPPDFALPQEAMKAAFTTRTKVVVINTPNNPTGRVLRTEELRLIADLCVDYDAIAVTDEIYEHIVYEGLRHVPMATIGDMAERTVTISGISKTYSVTGWRVAWAIAPPAISDAIKRIHDFLTVGAPAPLQEAAVTALQLPARYYEGLLQLYIGKRQRLLAHLRAAGMSPVTPEGAYYILCDLSDLGLVDDVAFAKWLVGTVGVAAVPGSSFYSRRADGSHLLRFTFSKKDETLDDAGARLAALPELLGRASVPGIERRGA